MMKQFLSNTQHTEYTVAAQFNLENQPNLPLAAQAFYHFSPLTKRCLLMTPKICHFPGKDYKVVQS